MKKYKNLLTANTKMQKTSMHFFDNKTSIYNFNIPAYKSKSGKIICPFAKDCILPAIIKGKNRSIGCYAMNGYYTAYDNPLFSEQKYQLTRTDKFVPDMTKEIESKKPKYIRIHDSGDFYSPEYLAKWLTIIRLFPNIRFYAYTKSYTFFTGLDLPENFDLIFSNGSKLESKIDITKYRHTKIFDSVEDLQKANYTDASNYDLYATKWHSDSEKVGLIYH